MNTRVECDKFTECEPGCEHYGKPIPPNQGTPTCRLIKKMRLETNPVTRCSYAEIIANRKEMYDERQ